MGGGGGRTDVFAGGGHIGWGGLGGEAVGWVEWFATVVEVDFGKLF